MYREIRTGFKQEEWAEEQEEREGGGERIEGQSQPRKAGPLDTEMQALLAQLRLFLM